jgi:hypothetical protein
VTQRITFETEDSLEVKGDGWVMRGEPTQGGYAFTFEFEVVRGSYRFTSLGAESMGEALNSLRPLMTQVAKAFLEAASSKIAFPSTPVDGKRWWQVWR